MATLRRLLNWSIRGGLRVVHKAGQIKIISLVRPGRRRVRGVRVADLTLGDLPIGTSTVVATSTEPENMSVLFAAEEGGGESQTQMSSDPVFSRSTGASLPK